MKKTVLALLLLSATLVPGADLFAQRLSSVGILPFEAAEGVSPGDAASATGQVIAELGSWGTITVLEGAQAQNAEYIVRGKLAKQGNMLILSATTQARDGKTLNEAKEQGAALGSISIVSFCAQVVENVPFPNYLLGKWQSTIDLPDGPISCIIEFKSDRTVVVERYDTWEHKQNNALTYEGYGTGTYSYAGYLRRNITIRDAQGNVQQRAPGAMADATAGLNLKIEETLPEQTNVNLGGLRLLFNDEKSAFEFVSGGLPCGRNFDGASVYPSESVAYTRFTKTSAPPPPASASPDANKADVPPVSAAPIWSRDLGDIATGTPFLQASSVVVACDSGSIKSWFMSGTSLWNFDPRDRATPFVARSYEGISYVCNNAGSFSAINRIGRELWRLDLGKPITFPPEVGWDGRVFIPVDSKISCRTASGRSLWNIDLGSAMTVAPVLDHTGSIATVLQNRDFVRINQFSSTERISLDRAPVLIVPLKDGDQNSYVLFYQSGETEKINFDNNAPKGNKLSRSRFISLPAAPAAAAGRENQFAVTLRDGRVLCIDGAGRTQWTGNSHETTAEKGAGNLTQAGMLFDERGIYSISARGASGFAANGRRRFILKYAAEASGIPGLSDEGLLYVCGKDKKLYAYKLDSKPRTIPRSKYYGPYPEGSYGMGNPPPSPWSSDSRRYQDDQQDEMYAIIEKTIRSGELGENEPDYVAYLMEMIGFFLNDPHYSPARPAVKPPQRIKLIRLLAQIGSRETVAFLWNIFDRDREPAIKAACAEAIGIIGIDPDGRTFQSYTYLLAANNPNRDPQIIVSAASSIANLCRYVGPPLAADGIYLLRLFMNLPSVPNSVKAQIRNEVDALGKEGLDKVIQ
ncbi:hypothetical protein AGMMS50293_11360 [Spirochaetia bacterium]|nr:hypothetical protein AGMMS50293_11360 [Spirochaetia bacterium]